MKIVYVLFLNLIIQLEAVASAPSYIQKLERDLPSSYFYHLGQSLFPNKDSSCEKSRPDNCKVNSLYNGSLKPISKTLVGQSHYRAKEREAKERQESLTLQKEWDWTKSKIEKLKTLTSHTEAKRFHLASYLCFNHHLTNKKCDSLYKSKRNNTSRRKNKSSASTKENASHFTYDSDESLDQEIQQTSEAYVKYIHLLTEQDQWAQKMSSSEQTIIKNKCLGVKKDCLVESYLKQDPEHANSLYQFKETSNQMMELLQTFPLLAASSFQKHFQNFDPQNPTSKEIDLPDLILKSALEQQAQLEKQYWNYEDTLEANNSDEQLTALRDPQLIQSLLNLPRDDSDGFYYCRIHERQRYNNTAETLSTIVSTASMITGPLSAARAIVFLGAANRLTKWGNTLLWGSIAGHESYDQHQKITSSCDGKLLGFLQSESQQMGSYQDYSNCKDEIKTKLLLNDSLGAVGLATAGYSSRLISALPKSSPQYSLLSTYQKASNWKIQRQLNKLKAEVYSGDNGLKISKFKNEHALRDSQKITPENEAFISKSLQGMVDEGVISLEQSMVYLKAINDKILKDKDLVDALKNFQNSKYQEYMEQELRKRGLSSNDTLIYTDYKGANSLDTRLNEEIRQKLMAAQDEAFKKSIEDLGQKVDELGLRPLFELAGEGSERQVEHMIKAARSFNSPDEAAVGLKFIKLDEDHLPGSIINLNEEKIAQRISQRLQQMDPIRKKAVAPLIGNTKVVEKYKGHYVFTEKYDQFLRKIGGPNRVRDSAPLAQQINKYADKVFSKRIQKAHLNEFGPPPLSQDDVKNIIDYYQLKNTLTMSPRQVSASSVDLSHVQVGDRVMSVDIVGAGGIGFSDVGKVFAGHHVTSLSEATQLARMAEQMTTETLKQIQGAMKRAVTSAIKDPKRRDQLNVQSSGDDFAISAQANAPSLTSTEMEKIQLAFQKDPQLQGRLRVTTLKVGAKSKAKALQPEEAKLAIVELENTQKKMVQHLPSRRFTGESRPDFVVTRDRNNKTVICYPPGLSSRMIRILNDAYYKSVSVTQRGSIKVRPIGHSQCQ